MNTQIKMMLTAFALTFASTAHAGYYQHLETCTADNAGPDHGISVEINAYHASQVGQEEVTTYATISSESIAGPVELGSYEVTFKEPSHVTFVNLGSYVGKNFSLVLSNLPTRGGKIANLTAIANQGGHTSKIVEALHCDDAPNL